jgi:hypothetical protein
VLQVIRGERPCKLYLDIESPIPPGTDHAAAVAENEARLDSLLEALRCFILARFSGEVCSHRDHTLPELRKLVPAATCPDSSHVP